MSLLAPGIPLSLYIHLPWCIEKCPYCDFNSHQVSDAFYEKKDEKKYIASLLTDLEQDLPRIWGRSVETIFIGGGTPSLFSGQAINELISGVRARLMLRADPEITLESNPGSADANNYLAYRQAGVNRLSIGVQSFDDLQLKKLGRIHDAKQATEAFRTARRAGFKRINIDLMYALPGQSIAEAMLDLDRAIALKPEHISWYQLTIEPNTGFNRYPPKQLPDDELIWDIQQAGAKKLQAAGFNQYEVSAWSQEQQECQHNINYWEFGDYLGIGAGAHGKITNLSEGQIYRTRRRKQPHHWLGDTTDYQVAPSAIKKADLAVEFMINAMRLNKGVSTFTFSERTGLGLNEISRALSRAKSKGLMDKSLGVLKPTDLGLNYLNDLLSLFMDADLSGSINIKEIT